MSKMNLTDKIGQLYQVSGDSVGSLQLNLLKQGRIGSYLNVKGVEDTRMLQEFAMNTSLRIPLIFGQDVIHGYRIHFPVPIAEAATWDLNAIRTSARVAATEAAAHGIHWTFAPMLDIARDPRWGRITEGAGEDPYLGSRIADARVRGFQGDGIGNIDSVIACAKHFVGYGLPEGGRDYNTVEMSNRTLWEVYMPPFKAAVDAGVGTFMSAFNDVSGIPSSGSEYLTRKVLHEQWGWKGFVVSDWESVIQLKDHGVAANDSEAARIGFNAGVDMEMVSQTYLKYLEMLVASGRVSMSTIDDSVARILTKKFELGLFDEPYKYCNKTREAAYFNNPTHRAAARDVAKRSIVLLNNPSNILPLSKTAKIAAIGPLVNSTIDMLGAWRVWQNVTPPIVSLLEGLRKASSAEVKYALGCDLNSTSDGDFGDALTIANWADVVVLGIGEGWDMAGEMRTRAFLGLPGIQRKLVNEIVAARKPTVAVVYAGRPLIIPDEIRALPLLFAWFPGTEAGNAVADVLFGDYNPSAKLPVSFPRAEGQIPIFYNRRNSGRPGLLNYIDLPITPAYPFGFGLSYSKFKYSNLRFDKATIYPDETIAITVSVQNFDGPTGEEVVQLYVRDLVASVARPIKELKSFQKVSIGAGLTINVVFNLVPQKDLVFYDENVKPVVEPGEFEVQIGTSSEQTDLRGTFTVIARQDVPTSSMN